MVKAPFPAPNPDLMSAGVFRHDRAFSYLKFLLLDGGLDPGMTFSTDEVARALNISRAPATDAVKRLVRDGFVTVVPQVGCQVCSPTPGEVEDFYRLFAKSEAIITGLAAERRTTEQAKQFETLVVALDGQYEPLRDSEQSGPQLRILNRRRHESIHAMANSKIADELVANMWDRSDFYIRIAYGQFVYSRSVHTANKKIDRAILRGDGDGAALATEAWLTKVGTQTAKRLTHRAVTN